MAEIKCPQCGTLISLEQSDLDSVVQQVRDEEFARELAERTKAFAAEKAQAVELAQTQAAAAAQRAAAALEAQVAQLQQQLEAQSQAFATEKELAVTQAVADIEKERAQQQAEAERERERLQAEAIRERERLQAEAVRERERLQAEAAREHDQLQAAIDKQNAQLEATLQVKESEKAALESQLREKLAAQAEKLAGKIEERDAVIRLREEEIERLKDMKAQLSTKMLGESLEQHCHDEFNRIRAVAFPNAYFEKDNDASEGSKGDFIFREEDEDGNEIISIMFEMKNESDSTSTKKKNEDHLAKLDKDRTKKGCEYAILVSLLEPESELYNEGIVDVSHRFPKMYVVRPQFFIPIISLLRNAALNSLEYKREAAIMRQQNLDITTFEADLDSFKDSFFRSFQLASERYDDAIDGIDRTIKLLEKIRENLTKSGKHLTSANNKLDDLSVKKLTRKNPTVRAMFEELDKDE